MLQEGKGIPHLLIGAIYNFCDIARKRIFISSFFFSASRSSMVDPQVQYQLKVDRPRLQDYLHKP